MGLKYSSFAIRGIDVSQFNGTIDWVKLTVITHNFCIHRGGYGRVTDSQFKRNWAESKGKVNRSIYWYMDYYSNHIKGWGVDNVSDRDWGRMQADACFAAQKHDPSVYVWLDIENGNPAYAPVLSSVATRAKTIAKAFLERMDELNKKKNGIYCSIGLLSWFDTWFKDRPLWVAWYNESQTVASVIKAVTATGWIGKCMIWQYASHGEIYGDGVAQGLNLGTKIKQLDLNVFMGTAADYEYLFGAPVVVVVTPEDEKPVEEPEDETPIDVTGEFLEYVINTRELNVRALPTTNSKIVGSYLSGWPVNVEKSVDLGIGSKTGWKRLYGQQGYLAMDHLKKV